MAKNAKKLPAKPAKPITDFFSRVPPSSSQLSSVSGTSTNASSHAKLNPEAPQTSKPNSGPSSVTLGRVSTPSQTSRSGSLSPSKQKGRIFMEAVEIVSPKKPRSFTNSQPDVAASTSLKRSRSQESRQPQRSSQREGLKPPSQVGKFQGRRKTKFDSSSDVEQLGDVVYVRRSGDSRGEKSNSLIQPPQSKPSNAPRKKARFSSPTSVSQESTANLVPSSQSDEEELAKKLAVPNANAVKQWRKQALPLSPDTMDGVQSVAMDIDDPYSSRHTTPISELEISAELKITSSSSVESSSLFNQFLTPPYTDGPSDDIEMPPIPVALDPATKTAEIIARIKAKAYENVSSSPEMHGLDIPDDLEESSDDEDPLPVFSLANGKGKMVAGSSRVSPGSNGLRRSSRSRPSLSSSSRDGSPTSRTGRQTRSSLNKSSVLTPEDGRKGKEPPKKGRYSRKILDPLDALLKEKKLADKQGRGDNAFQTAETAVNRLERSDLLDEMNLEESSGRDWEIDGLVPSSSRIRDSFSGGPLSRDNSLIEVDDVFLADEDRRRLFGDDGGKDIMNILESDRVTKKEAEENAKVEGVSLWSSPSEDTMDVDEIIPMFEYEGNNAIFRLLKTALHQRDTARAVLLLDSGVLGTLEDARESQVIHDLCVLALTWKENTLSEAAFRVVLKIWSQPSSAGPAPGISVGCVVGALLHLGASPSALRATGSPPPCVVSQTRETVLYRLVALVTASAQTQRLAINEVPDLVMAILRIAIDPSSSEELRLDCMVAINLGCRCMASESNINRELESKLAARIVACATMYQPVNKAFILSFLAGGTGSAMRIARYVAFCMLTNTRSESVISANYTDPPPLTPIINQLIHVKHLSSDSGSTSHTPYLFAINEETDYANLECYVRILSVAMSNVRGYVELERKHARAKASSVVVSEVVPQSPSKHGDKKPETELQLLHLALEELHAGIVDTRAAHLDRSRTKAAVKGVQMRIYYQKAAWERAGNDSHRAKSGNLKNWLTAKNKVNV